MENKVGIYKQYNLYYSERPPYYPPAIFPEYPFSHSRVDKKNEAYFSVRELLRLLGLDAANFNTNRWNPFSSFISPGQTVLLKPNFMRHFSDRGGTKGLITHGSIIRAVADYAYIALKGKGRIIIADGPMDEGDFEKIAKITGLHEIRQFYKDNAYFDIEIYDLRQERVFKKKDKIYRRMGLAGDPCGYSAVDLGKESEFKKGDLDYRTFLGSECIREVMLSHHNDKKDEYLISNTLLQADVVINIPKMKTHNKAGVTLGLKNMIGITGDRNWLPHFKGNACHRCGNGKKRKSLVNMLKHVSDTYFGRVTAPIKNRLKYKIGLTESEVRSGNWYGNDIIWRTIADLSRICIYADKNGRIAQDKKRTFFTIIDGIIAGECEGPMNPDVKPAGVLVAGFDIAYTDMVTARIMGFDPMKIPVLFNISGANGKNVECVSNIKEWNRGLSEFKGRCLNFKPSYGWKGYIEAENGKK